MHTAGNPQHRHMHCFKYGLHDRPFHLTPTDIRISAIFARPGAESFRRAFWFALTVYNVLQRESLLIITAAHVLPRDLGDVIRISDAANFWKKRISNRHSVQGFGCFAFTLPFCDSRKLSQTQCKQVARLPSGDAREKMSKALTGVHDTVFK